MVGYTGRHRVLPVREVMFCVEDGCPFPAHVARPVTEPWLYEGGVIGPDDAVEWVCDDHAGTATARSVSR